MQVKSVKTWEHMIECVFLKYIQQKAFALYFDLQGCLKCYAFKKKRINNTAAGYIVRAHEWKCTVCMQQEYTVARTLKVHMICCCNVGLRIMIALVVVVVVMLTIMMVAMVVAVTLLLFLLACWLAGWLAAAAAYAMQQPTAIRNKTSTHALDINRIVKSMAVIA